MHQDVSFQRQADRVNQIRGGGHVGPACSGEGGRSLCSAGQLGCDEAMSFINQLLVKEIPEDLSSSGGLTCILP